MEMPFSHTPDTVLYQQNIYYPQATHHLTKYYSDGHWTWREPELHDSFAPHLSLEAEGMRLATEEREARRTSEDAESDSDSDCYSEEPFSISSGTVNEIFEEIDTSDTSISPSLSDCDDDQNSTGLPLFGGANYDPNGFPYWAIQHTGKALPPGHSLPSEAFNGHQKTLKEEYERRKASGEEMFSEDEESDGECEHVFYTGIGDDSKDEDGDGYDSDSTATTRDEWDAEDSDEDFNFSSPPPRGPPKAPVATFTNGGVGVEVPAVQPPAGRGKSIPTTGRSSQDIRKSSISTKTARESQTTSTPSEPHTQPGKGKYPARKNLKAYQLPTQTGSKRKSADEDAGNSDQEDIGANIKRRRTTLGGFASKQKKTVDADIASDEEDDDEEEEEYRPEEEDDDEDDEDEDLYNDNYMPAKNRKNPSKSTSKPRAQTSKGKKPARPFKSRQPKKEKEPPEYLKGPFPDDGFQYATFNMWTNKPVNTGKRKGCSETCLCCRDSKRRCEGMLPCYECIKLKKAGGCCYVGTPQAPRNIKLYYQRGMIRRMVHGNYTITEDDFEHVEE
ncbi:hypothetical protein L202_07636 [Cryptococcus amylolentus CBS 6039]|uniref:Zn(2)-C6 fungal-type domain-containing protein n=2 Tax=Cryptococcus amylolentus TaxID=104669 RepID=A0A1E3HDI3_9TREE|nr:hypothetical protein L202_07636 [Cryptococcus amylolentus CBS 6039]ODN74185.1 hypothetical protein L202_07636 [Cryptococcus amylolentus CBS 6039]ODO00043.1 hypothetical protein I350_06666 [Cryptococcus amylolentus CBS 6273]